MLVLAETSRRFLTLLSSACLVLACSAPAPAPKPLAQIELPSDAELSTKVDALFADGVSDKTPGYAPER